MFQSAPTQGPDQLGCASIDIAFKACSVPLGDIKKEIGIPNLQTGVSSSKINLYLSTFFPVTCRMTDWCLRNSKEDDFDWSSAAKCTSTKYTGPCADPIKTDQGILFTGYIAHMQNRAKSNRNKN